MLKRLSHLPVLLGFALPHHTYAIDHDDVDFFEMSIEDLLEVTVNGATLTNESLKTVPAAVSVFTQDDFSRMGVDTVEELLNFVPGFQQYRNGDSSKQTYSSRGHKAGTNAIEVLMLIDGNRIETNSIGGSDSIMAQTFLERIEKIEFIRGPNAIIYGSNTYMGVINITTLQHKDIAQVKAGSHEHLNTFLSTSTTFDNTHGQIDVFAQYVQDKGETYNVPSTFQAGREDTSDPIKHGLLQAKLAWYHSSLNISYTKYRTEGFYIAGRVSDQYNNQEKSDFSASFQQDFPVNDQYTSSVRFAYHKRDTLYDVQVSPEGQFAQISNPASSAPLITRNEADMHDSHFRWFNDLTLTDHQSIQFGLEHRYQRLEESTLENNYSIADIRGGVIPIQYYDGFETTRVFAPRSSQHISSGFAQYQLAAYHWLDVNLGLRYDHYSDIGDNVSPKLAVMLHPSTAHTFKFIYSTGYNAPNFVQRFAGDNTTIVGNPDLKAETVETFEIVWLAQFDTSQLTINYFHNTFEDSISQELVNGVRMYTNASDSQKGQGVELDVQSFITDSLVLRLGSTLIFENIDTAYRESNNLFSGLVNYNYRDWNLNLGGYYHSERQTPMTGDDDLKTLDGYWLAHTKVMYHFLPKWEGFLQVKNLFDKQYTTPSQSPGVEEGTPNPGREIRLGVTWNFKDS